MSSEINLAVEGVLDEAIMRRLIEDAGGSVGLVIGRKGKAYLRGKAEGLLRTATGTPWIVLVDLNSERDCAPGLVTDWIGRSANRRHLRVAVRAIESWILADRERVAELLGVPGIRVPRGPEDLSDPRRRLLELARRSSKPAIKRGLLPSTGSGRAHGPDYNSALVQFVHGPQQSWRPVVAATSAASLGRCRAFVHEVMSR